MALTKYSCKDLFLGALLHRKGEDTNDSTGEIILLILCGRYHIRRNMFEAHSFSTTKDMSINSFICDIDRIVSYVLLILEDI